MSAVTAACAAVRREAWDQVGGLDEKNLPIAFNDVDFCLRLRAAGWEVVWTPYAELYHHESTSRGPDTIGPRAAAFAREVAYMETRWGSTACAATRTTTPISRSTRRTTRWPGRRGSPWCPIRPGDRVTGVR